MREDHFAKNKFILDLILTITAVIIIILIFIYSFGGFNHLTNITGHNPGNIHRYTARALLEGKLYLPGSFIQTGLFDLQFYNGTTFTNWGYGVPLLQLPFHWIYNLANKDNSFSYFPDRLIFIFYFILCVLLFYTGLKKLFQLKFKINNFLLIHAFTLSLTLFLFTTGLFWLSSLTLYVYQETISYLILMEFFTTGFFLHYYMTKDNKWLISGALSAGFAILIRPTGLPYYVIWILIFAFCRRSKKNESLKKMALFVLVSLPLICLWFGTNYAKSGRFFSTGIENTHSFYIEEIDNTRFQKTNNPGIWIDNAKKMFFALFIGKTKSIPLKFQNNNDYFDYKDHLMSEKIKFEPNPFIDGTSFIVETQATYHIPFFGLFYLFLTTIAVVYFLIFHRRRMFYLLSILLFWIIFFTHLSGSFITLRIALRYCGDFYPAIILLFLFLIISTAGFKSHFDKREKGLIAGLFLFLLLFSTYYNFSRHITTQSGKILTMPSVDAPGFETNNFESKFRNILTYWNNYHVPDFSNFRLYTDPLASPIQDRLYWDMDGKVQSITNFFIGVKPKSSKIYQLNLETSGVINPIPLIYINGKYYKPTQEADLFYVKFFLDYEKLVTPNILVTIKWGFTNADYQNTKLLSAFLF